MELVESRVGFQMTEQSVEDVRVNCNFLAVFLSVSEDREPCRRDLLEHDVHALSSLVQHIVAVSNDALLQLNVKFVLALQLFHEAILDWHLSERLANRFFVEETAFIDVFSVYFHTVNDTLR